MGFSEPTEETEDLNDKVDSLMDDDDSNDAIEKPTDITEIHGEMTDKDAEAVEKDTMMPTMTDVATDATGSTAFSVKKLMVKGNLYGLQFISDGKIYDMPMSMVLDLGIPLNSIPNSVEKVEHNGFNMTTDERSMKTFAVDISSNIDICKTLYNKIFDF